MNALLIFSTLKSEKEKRIKNEQQILKGNTRHEDTNPIKILYLRLRNNSCLKFDLFKKMFSVSYKSVNITIIVQNASG